MSKSSEYHAAVMQAENKKAGFLANAREARARVSPSRLKNDAKAKVKQTFYDGKESAKATAVDHPVAVSAAAVGIAAFLLRRPLCRLLKGGYARLRKPRAAQTEFLGERLKKKLHSAASAVRFTGD
ncbi:MAG: hypothetical protein ACSLE1_05430 [Sphingobium sp.]